MRSTLFMTSLKRDNIELEPDPLSIKRLITITLLAVALVILPSTLTDKRINVDLPFGTVETKRLDFKLGIAQLDKIVPETAPEPPQAPVVAEVVETPPPVVPEPVAPVKPVEQPKPVAKPSGSCEAEIAKYNWNQATATAVARAESGLNPLAVNKNARTKDHSIGCFQVNIYGANAKSRPSEAQLKNPAVNVAFAHKIYSANGSSFKGQWGVCRSKVKCY
jgi:outer membrane biosynthesis protein TonB